MQLRPSTAFRLTRVAGLCSRAAMHSMAGRAAAGPAQQAASLGRSPLFGSPSLLLLRGGRAGGHFCGGSRGLRTTPVTMGLRTGIVGLPNVGKVGAGQAGRDGPLGVRRAGPTSKSRRGQGGRLQPPCRQPSCPLFCAHLQLRTCKLQNK